MNWITGLPVEELYRIIARCPTWRCCADLQRSGIDLDADDFLELRQSIVERRLLTTEGDHVTTMVDIGIPEMVRMYKSILSFVGLSKFPKQPPFCCRHVLYGYCAKGSECNFTHPRPDQWTPDVVEFVQQFVQRTFSERDEVPHPAVAVDAIPDVPHTPVPIDPIPVIPDTAVPVDSPPKVSDTVVSLRHSVDLQHPAVLTESRVLASVVDNAPCTKAKPESFPRAHWSHLTLRRVSATMPELVLRAQAALWFRVTLPAHVLCANAAHWYRVFDRGKGHWYRVFDRGKGMSADSRGYFGSFECYSFSRVLLRLPHLH